MRRRRPSEGSNSEQPDVTSSEAPTLQEETKRLVVPPSDCQKDATPSFRVAQCVMVRLLGGVYFFAFYGAFLQNEGLVGSHGLQPAWKYMERLSHSERNGFTSHPTIFWWMEVSDLNLNLVAGIGTLLSLIVACGWGHVYRHSLWALFVALWLLDFSIVTIAGGTSFYSYGWESQLLETGFLAIWLCRLPWIDSFNNREPSKRILWLFRWLCFRISIGAGLIKVRGSTCWAKKTCLHYHFETQPIPSPLSFVFHFLPKRVLTHAVDLDLFVQLYTSWFVLVPWLRRWGGYIQAGFMINILLSGNFAFLNHVTIVPALACLDNTCWPKWLCKWVQGASSTYIGRASSSLPSPRLVLDLLLVSLIGFLSLPVVTNLFGSSGRQVMNASFDPFRIVNTYGAFGSVGEARYEPIVSVKTKDGEWTELELPCKPGKLTRRPCFCAPYHYRLDWNIWFIGFKPHQAYLRQRESWLYILLGKLLDSKDDHKPWLNLLDKSTAFDLRQLYLSDNPPRYAKVEMYHYQMAHPLWNMPLKDGEEIAWWNRTLEESLVAPVEWNGATKQLQLAAVT